MSELQSPLKCFLFCSCLYNENNYKEDFQIVFSDRYGKTFSFEHPFFPMKEFYANEMGNSKNLKRIILVSEKLFDRNCIVNEKIWATEFEIHHSQNKQRSINIDIGILSLENLILATGKSFCHRVYLDRGVYADLNLVYKDNSYESLSWTYPDYAHSDFIQFFNWARSLLLTKLKSS